jgi:hypothetical protein
VRRGYTEHAKQLFASNPIDGRPAQSVKPRHHVPAVPAPAAATSSSAESLLNSLQRFLDADSAGARAAIAASAPPASSSSASASASTSFPPSTLRTSAPILKLGNASAPIIGHTFRVQLPVEAAMPSAADRRTALRGSALFNVLSQVIETNEARVIQLLEQKAAELAAVTATANANAASGSKAAESATSSASASTAAAVTSPATATTSPSTTFSSNTAASAAAAPVDVTVGVQPPFLSLSRTTTTSPSASASTSASSSTSEITVQASVSAERSATSASAVGTVTQTFTTEDTETTVTHHLSAKSRLKFNRRDAKGVMVDLSTEEVMQLADQFRASVSPEEYTQAVAMVRWRGQGQGQRRGGRMSGRSGSHVTAVLTL